MTPRPTPSPTPEERLVMAELTPEQIASMGTGGLIAYVGRLVDGHSPQFGVNRQTGEVYQQVCECGNPACIRCVLAAYRSVMIAGYNAKVQDFAAETLARSAAERTVRELREALERCIDTAKELRRHIDPNHGCGYLVYMDKGRLQIALAAAKRTVREQRETLTELESDRDCLRWLLDHNGFTVVEGDFTYRDGSRGRFVAKATDAARLSALTSQALAALAPNTEEGEITT